MALRRPSPIRLANEQVPITAACRLIGMSVPDEIWGRSAKVRCPFGELYHRDGGAEASFRVYPEANSAYCFSCAQSYSPVWLIAQAWGLTSRAAAVELLERAGIKPVSLADAWAAVAVVEDAPDQVLLAEALKTFCERIGPELRQDWDDAQFQPAIAAALSRCLDLLDRVRTGADADQWLSGCKQAMRRALSDTTHSTGDGCTH